MAQRGCSLQPRLTNRPSEESAIWFGRRCADAEENQRDFGGVFRRDGRGETQTC